MVGRVMEEDVHSVSGDSEIFLDYRIDRSSVGLTRDIWYER